LAGRTDQRAGAARHTHQPRQELRCVSGRRGDWQWSASAGSRMSAMIF
jgi:hypothetical protein